MDCNASLDFQPIFVTDNQSLDSPIEIMKYLQLDRRLPEGTKTCEEVLKAMELQPAPEDQEHTTDKQFVFHGQCLILGDSGVGKTSLVKSLTGEPFDPRQVKTQGIAQSLVDNSWNNLNMKAFVFGVFHEFYKRHVLHLTFFAPGNARNIVFQESLDWAPDWALMIMLLSTILLSLKESAVVNCTLYFFFLLVEIVKLCAPRQSSINLSCCILINAALHHLSRALTIGALLALVLFETINFSGVLTIQGYLCGAIVLAPVVAALFLYRNTTWSLGIKRQCPYPGQVTLTNQHSMGMICFSRLLLTIFLGFSSCNLFASFCKPSLEVTAKHIDGLTNVFLFCLIFETVPGLIESKPGPNTIILIFVVTNLARASWNSPSSYFVVIFPLFFFDTVYREWLPVQWIRNVHNNETGSKSFTAIAIIIAVLNNKALKRALDKTFSSLKLKILDFAGDEDYYAYHHMFLRRQAIYVIVFNMAEFTQNEFGDIDAKVKRLQFWFESVCSQVPANAPIFLAGTHRGNTDRTCMEILDGHLRRHLWDTYCDELVVNEDDNLIFFPVENSKGNNADTGVQALQNKIISVAEECKETIAHDIPLSWIRIQDAVISLQEKKAGKFCVTLEELPAAFDNLVCTNWSKETLKYFHEKGLIIYLDRNQDLDLSNWVLLKPELLVDIIIQLVTPPENTQQRGLRRDWNLLQKKGMLTKSLLKSIINKVLENEAAVTAFLEEYDLICPLVNKNVELCTLDAEQQPIHFVPSLLPMSADGDLTVWDDDAKDKTFYVFFDRFLPAPLFHRLLSRAHKNSKIEFPNGPTVLYRDAGKFWMNACQPYKLRLIKEQKMVEVTFSRR